MFFLELFNSFIIIRFNLIRSFYSKSLEYYANENKLKFLILKWEGEIEIIFLCAPRLWVGRQWEAILGNISKVGG